MKTTTIISSAALVLSTLTSAAPTHSTSTITNISKRTLQTEERRDASAASLEKKDASASAEAQEATVEVRADEDFLKRQAQEMEEREEDATDACVVM